jgi:hypothetical protein
VRAPDREEVYLHRAFFMATLKPFAALRPQPELAAQICELPYDVMSSDEAREIARGNPLSFLRVSKPEIDLPAGADLYSPEVYAKGRCAWTASPIFISIARSWATTCKSGSSPPPVARNT